MATTDIHALERAKKCILHGEIVAFPTESFYALGVDATNESAIRSLFSIKKRDTGSPILILISSREQVQDFATDIPEVTQDLMDTFWPGGLTLVLKAKGSVSQLLTSRTGKIGIRLSSHPVPTALSRMTGKPLTGTSANLSGKPPCSTALEVEAVFGGKIGMIVDAGRTEAKKPSTVLDLTSDPPEILRHGIIPVSEIEKVLSNR